MTNTEGGEGGREVLTQEETVLVSLIKSNMYQAKSRRKPDGEWGLICWDL